MKSLLFLAVSFALPSAFAAGDMPLKLDAQAAAKYFAQYQNEASEVGCSGWMATGGDVIGGGEPGFESYTITLNIIQSKSPERSTFVITKTTADKNTTLSFECKR